MVEQKARVAVLFADVSDSTRLYDALGDATAFGRVREILALLTGVTGERGGRVVKAMGDGIMCVFPTPDQAAAAAAEMEAAVAQLPPVEGDRKLAIRIGYHFGVVIQAGEDVFGDCVNVAARVASLAFDGQVLTTGETQAQVSDGVRSCLRRLAAIPVKGKAVDVEVYEQLWQVNATGTLIADHMPGLADGARLRLVYRQQELTFADSVEFGREPAAGVVMVTAPKASRRHARIERRGGKFVLVDRSSNGTYVTLGTNEEIHLRREELILHGVGVISFGQRASAPDAEVVEFHCS